MLHIDQFDDFEVIIESETELFRVPREAFPKDIHERDVVFLVGDGRYEVDKEMTEHEMNRMRLLFNSVKRKKD